MRKNWDGETCACCTREQRLVWSVKDIIWKEVVIDYYIDKTLCLECFLRMAEDRQFAIPFWLINITNLVSGLDQQQEEQGK